jgi:hypothetical protein
MPRPTRAGRNIFVEERRDASQEDWAHPGFSFFHKNEHNEKRGENLGIVDVIHGARRNAEKKVGLHFNEWLLPESRICGMLRRIAEPQTAQRGRF